LKLSAVADDDSAEPVASLGDVPAGLEAAAHRIVHGGGRFVEPVLVDDDVEHELARLVDLAPLHMGPALAALREARTELPDISHVAVFDSAFHATIPDEAATYPLPRRVREEWGIRRYGFHGLSVQWTSERVRAERLVVCHLGGGCSVSAVRAGRSVDTTMGFTPLEGIPMATRPGSVDPGALLYLLRHHLTLNELDHLLEHDSGLLGLSGISGRVEELEHSDEPAARLALDVFAYRIAGAVGTAAVALGGIDALAFTAGVGEGSAAVRDSICRRLRFLGLELDVERNRTARPDTDLTAPGSRVRVVVVRAREDIIAARAARALLDS
jgi:acetate kinase